MSPMDHAYAEEHGLVDAYLADRLSEAERNEFEAHYFDCARCLEQLETAEDFGAGLRQVAAEEIAPRLGLLAALAHLSRGGRLALGALLLLLAALPLGLLLARGRSTAAPADPRVGRLEAELRALRERGARPSSGGGPQVNVPVFLLAAVRSAGEGREPVNRLPLANATGSVMLTVELATADAPAYRATLQGPGGKEIWRTDGLRPDSRDALTLLLPASMLPPGDYRLTLEGAKDGRTFPVGVYPFRVTSSS
jgi:hypothetical protein